MRDPDKYRKVSKLDFTDAKLAAGAIRNWEIPENLKQLDQQLSTNESSSCWIRQCRIALGMSYSALASRMNIKRQSIQSFEKAEASGKISIESMAQVAAAMDCEFVYYFAPKTAPDFRTLVGQKVLPFVAEPPPIRELSLLQAMDCAAQRIECFLKKPTGWEQIWDHPPALKKTGYNWTKNFK